MSRYFEDESYELFCESEGLDPEGDHWAAFEDAMDGKAEAYAEAQAEAAMDWREYE